MTREELTALRDAIDAMLAWPDNVRDEIARWLTPEAAQKPGNGVDQHPPVAPTGKALKNGNLPNLDLPVSASETEGLSSRRSPTPYPGKARRGRSPLSGKAVERKLLEAMRESPGLSVAALAKATSAGRSTTGERLRQLAARGAIEKGDDGRWRTAGEEAPRPAEASPRPTVAPSS